MLASCKCDAALGIALPCGAAGGPSRFHRRCVRADLVQRMCELRCRPDRDGKTAISLDWFQGMHYELPCDSLLD